MSPSFMKLILAAAVALPLGFAGAGCDRAQAPQSSGREASATPAEPLPAALFLTAAPADAKDLTAVKKDAKDGDEVTVRARVGGRADPFVEGRAAMTVMDLSQKNCKDIEGDACATPWDYCCVPANEIAAHSATVQVLGPDGKPLRSPLKNANGLKPLDEVVVKGTVSKSPDGNALVINATSLYVKGS